MAVRKSQNKWVISDDENEDEEVGLDVKELFALSKKKPGSDPQGNNSENAEAYKFHSANEELDTSQASSQLTRRESDTEKYFTADEDITSNTRLEDSMNAESISDEDEDSEANIRPKVGRSRCAVIYDDEDEGSDVIINEKEDVINNGPENSNTQKNLISDEEEEEEEEGEEEEETTDNEVSQNNEPLPKRSKIVKPFSTEQGIQNSTEKNWWNQLLEPVPDSQKCKIDNCSFAPPDHKKHDLNIRSYTSYETRLIIKYLIYYDLIQYGKGLQVWKDFHSLGTLRGGNGKQTNRNRCFAVHCCGTCIPKQTLSLYVSHSFNYIYVQDLHQANLRLWHPLIGNINTAAAQTPPTAKGARANRGNYQSAASTDTHVPHIRVSSRRGRGNTYYTLCT